MTFSHSRIIKSPPPGGKFTLLRSPPEQLVKVRKPVASSHLPLPCPKESEVKVQEEPQRGMAKMEDHTKTEGEEDRKGHRSNGDLGPRRHLGPRRPAESSLASSAILSLWTSFPKSRVIRSDGDPGDVLPPWKPESRAMVFSVPAARCSPLLERPTKEVLSEDHRPSSPRSLMSGKELQREKSSDVPSRSSASLASTSGRPCKRNIPLTLFLLLPGLRSTLPLTWDQGELPPAPKLPCLALAKNPGTLEKNTECQRIKILNNIRKVKEDFSAPQPAPSLSPPASQTADSLPLTIHPLEVPATTTDSADLYSRSPILSVPPPSPTPNIDQETRDTVPKLPKNEGPFHSVIATTPLTSDLPTPPSIPAFSFQPPSREKEPPTPICPMTSMAIPSTSMVMAPGSLTFQPTVDPDVTDMDTPALPQAVTFRSPPGFRVEQRHPAGVPVSITPPVPMVPCATPNFNHPFGPQTNPQPIFGTSDGQQRASLPGAPVFPRPPFTASAIIGASAGSTSDTEAMDPTPPSYAVILQSAPVSRTHHPVVAMPQPMPRLIFLQRRPTDKHLKLLLDPGLPAQATLGANDGQRPNDYFLLGNPAAPAQGKVLTSPAAQPPGVSIMQSALPASLFATTINTQPAFGDNPGILPRAVSIATGFGVATRMPSTGNSSSLFANTTPGPLFMGPAAPTAGGSLGVSVSAPGLTHSEASRPLNFGAELSGAPSTTCSYFGPDNLPPT
ncbi:nuclear pore-associated protein 1 [Monodon monoceros]|uniref:nuclear pore-associated protein 1 n=1 Tax=Monodon monoceros TaxID=40151 RepID=UPI0010F45997|nr:nuclear pore-associated protein 1 [Monodon monoceros]